MGSMQPQKIMMPLRLPLVPLDGTAAIYDASKAYSIISIILYEKNYFYHLILGGISLPIYACMGRNERE